MIDLHLKSGKDRPVRFGHPWIFSGAIRDLDPGVDPGTIVRVFGADGTCLGRGYCNPACTIAVRMLTPLDEEIDAAFIRRRVADALALRAALVGPETTAYRLINGEGDRLPGIVADRYGDVVVLQCLTAGAERFKALVVDALLETLRPQCLYERSEGSVRRAEGLSPHATLWHGTLPAETTVSENGLTFAVDPEAGQKTGLFLDQRPNHALCRALARGRRVLDAFCYTGGFGVAAGAGGAARVVLVDSSARGVAAAQRNWELNALDAAGAEFVHGDVAQVFREATERFDLIVLDPPALVKHRSEVPRGTRAYKDLHLWALRCAEPGALLLTFSCSQHIDAGLFRKIIVGAAADVRRAVQLVQHLGPGPDHPAALDHVEGEYLHGLLLRVL